MTLAEKIINIIDLNTTVDEKMKQIEINARDEIRMQALKAIPAKAKLSTTLTKMYKDNAKLQERYKGYIKLNTGFALTNSYYLVRVFDVNPDEMLPSGTEEVQTLTEENINRLFNNINTDLRHDVTVSYSDVIAHIKLHGRSKKTLKNQIFSVPNTDLLLNVFYLEYAFKIAQTKELTLKVFDHAHPVYVQGEGWDMILCPIRNKK